MSTRGAGQQETLRHLFKSNPSRLYSFQDIHNETGFPKPSLRVGLSQLKNRDYTLYYTDIAVVECDDRVKRWGMRGATKY